jgi:hypothetical protein
MTLPPTIARARSFLAVVTEGEPPSDEQLARSLDQLALAYHDCPQGSPADAEPGGPDFLPKYSEVGARFPDFGYYASADPTTALDEKPTVGDAIDDLVDIVRDLREVSWRHDVLGADDAHWHFRFLFQIHWGRHLRDLSLYLHARQFG